MYFGNFPYFRCVNKTKFLHTVTFVLLTLMFFKVSALHVYGHQDDSLNQIENCKICDSAIENQNAEHLANTSFSVEAPQISIIETVPIFEYSQLFTSPKVHFRLFGRPPPSLG
jgi:hypothetical protein